MIMAKLQETRDRLYLSLLFIIQSAMSILTFGSVLNKVELESVLEQGTQKVVSTETGRGFLIAQRHPVAQPQCGSLFYTTWIAQVRI